VAPLLKWLGQRADPIGMPSHEPGGSTDASSPMPDRSPLRSGPWWRRLVVGASIGGAVLVGSSLLVLALTVGRCDAFGGRCPAEPPSLLDDDSFGTAALGGVLVAGIPTFLWHPSKRRLLVAVGMGLIAALFFGLLARSLAAAPAGSLTSTSPHTPGPATVCGCTGVGWWGAQP
jgi:hypothetical protein